FILRKRKAMDDNDERLGGHVTIVIPEFRNRRARMLIGFPVF
ncbi:unnamed protein product, partial [marine sediment metagenome]